MTTPNQPAPDDVYLVGGGSYRYGQNLTEATAKSIMRGGVVAPGGSAAIYQGNLNEHIRDPIVVAQGSADQAVTEAQAAANAAAAAEDYADKAYENASFWIIECVVASAAVVLGVNELLLGPVLNVPDDQAAFLSDIHIALLDQPNGMVIETKKWNDEGTTSTTITTTELIANQTRANVPALDYRIYDKERFYYNITSVTGDVAPQVLQIAVAGAYVPLSEV